MYIRVADVSDRDENLKGIVFIRFPDTTFYISLYFCFAFLSVTVVQR